MKYIDIHCHLSHEKFDIDRDEVIARAKENDIGMIVVGTSYKDSEKAIKIAEENENIWAIIGLHPTEIANESNRNSDHKYNQDNKENSHGEHFNFDLYKKLAENPKVVGIGECGFDYFHKENGGGYKNKALQQEVFEKHIAIANELKKPLMLHLRNGLNTNENAYRDALEVLKKHSRVHGVVHFFAGNWEEAKQFLDIGFRLSFTGVITFARNYDEVIKNIPLNMIMTETDAPFVAPISHRGERNESSFIIEISNEICRIKGGAVDNFLPHFVDNARKLFNI